MRQFIYLGVLTFTFMHLIACGQKRMVSRPISGAQEPKSSIYDFKMAALDGKMIDFQQFKGRKILIVNTASKCYYTPQYEALEQLNKLHGDKVAILGFPANNFAGQEPGSDDEIATFCKANYGVTFQMFSKVSVKGKDMDPLYQWLTDKTKNGWNSEEPSWNFCKYLINEQGYLEKFYGSAISPMGEEILNDIQ